MASEAVWSNSSSCQQTFGTHPADFSYSPEWQGGHTVLMAAKVAQRLHIFDM